MARCGAVGDLCTLAGLTLTHCVGYGSVVAVVFVAASAVCF